MFAVLSRIVAFVVIVVVVEDIGLLAAREESEAVDDDATIEVVMKVSAFDLSIT